MAGLETVSPCVVCRTERGEPREQPTVLERLVVLLYCQFCAYAVASLARKMFARGRQVDRIPPIHGALVQHSKEATLHGIRFYKLFIRSQILHSGDGTVIRTAAGHTTELTSMKRQFLANSFSSAALRRLAGYFASAAGGPTSLALICARVAAPAVELTYASSQTISSKRLHWASLLILIYYVVLNCFKDVVGFQIGFFLSREQ